MNKYQQFDYQIEQKFKEEIQELACVSRKTTYCIGQKFGKI